MRTEPGSQVTTTPPNYTTILPDRFLIKSGEVTDATGNESGCAYVGLTSGATASDLLQFTQMELNTQQK